MDNDMNLRLRRIYLPNIGDKVSFDISYAYENIAESFTEALTSAGVATPQDLTWIRAGIKSNFWVCNIDNLFQAFDYFSKIYRYYTLVLGHYKKIRVQLSYTESILYDLDVNDFVFKDEDEKKLFEKCDISQESALAHVRGVLSDLEMFVK